MARWDDILMLPVQEPPTIVFNSSDLNWSKVEGWGQNVDNVARIPFSRVDDFVKGESSSTEYPTKFRVEARRKKTDYSSYKPRVDGYLEYILYWCCYGPDDHRKGGTSRPSRKCIKPSKKKSSAGRPHTKRGCMCHFIVKRLYAQPSVALIIYNQRKHVDKSGSPCHGPLDTKAIGTLALYAPYISEELRQQIMSMLYAGISVESIIQNHKNSVERQGGPCNRDAFLSRRFVRTVERNIRRATHELDSDDALSIKLWVESHQNQVFYYQESSQTDAFILGVQTEWQLQQMLRFGKNSLIAVDSSCGTKKFKYPIYTLLAFDSNQTAIPIAWIIAGSLRSHDVFKWMGTLHDRVRAKDSTWRLNGFIIDDAATEIFIIRDVFQCTILLCLWRVRHAWHRNIIKKCANAEMQREMLKRLGHVMYNTWSGSNVINAMEDFMEDFVDHSAFMEYFKARWMQRIEMWVTAMRILPVASQETCAAIEAYHSILKSRMLSAPDMSTYQRADWLVHKLTNEVHAYFWVDQFSVENDLFGYARDENYASTSWRKALLIADSDVIFNEKDHTSKVISQSDRTRTYIVWNPGSEFALCECSWSMSGNLCKHVIKTGMVCCDRQMARPSMALKTYHQALLSLLHGPPNGSVVLDNAISLAIGVHQDLKRQVEPANHGYINSLLSPVPVKWVCKKSRTSRQKASVENGNNNSICGHRVTTDADDGAINKTGLDENVITDTEDGAIDKTGLDENVMIDTEDGVINETVLDENVMADAEDGAINKIGLDENVMIDAEDGVINKTVLDENVLIDVEDGAIDNAAFDENFATDVEDGAINDIVLNGSAATEAEDGAINNAAFNENVATDSEDGVISKGALDDIVTTYAEEKAVNKILLDKSVNEILLDKSVISVSMDSEEGAINKGALDEIVTTYAEDEAIYKTSLDEIISSYAEDETINGTALDEIVATYAEDTSALDDIVTTYAEDEAINKTALDEIITSYAEDVGINKSALDEIVATYGEDGASNKTSMDENDDSSVKLQF
ncbi:hypothetical protein SUGI_0021320 [Cryptomeria japonica]|uniref:uncharacterized protein LOC131029014 n=1 Tax=Cryptomeria japonica TaxID=3369 RepID=UPI002408EA8D|nr:uncharacterized protein LOC131029014 [Cryptomeria japonica]XP_057815388.2 uncharacterized protein LOC131029014 [Cryptomeria japonica]XP_057815390.2 uncharacterized protein LOC131029014 [Cryptomeria japonica]XP_057815392.2 uncharacterized protein LOC131029014 [Cryptomeria japonica]GLJ05616.1 hypothetical protein SUGI_0021320 [Cryptomeria japonica]